MWIFRNDAMLSVVENWDDPTLLLVRSRQHGDIEKVFPNAETFSEVGKYDGVADTRMVAQAQNRYAYWQKQNPHTPRTMKALGLDDGDVDHFVEQCLFPYVGEE